MAARNGLERWRGETTEALRTLKEAAKEHKNAIDALGDRLEAALTKHVGEDKADFATVNSRVDAANAKAETVAKAQASLRGKVAIVSAGIGAIVAAVLQAVIAKAFGSP